MSEVKYVKMLSGEDVIAEVEVQGSTVKLTHPLVAIPDGKSLGFMPFAPLIDQSIEYVNVSKSAIVFITTPAAEIIDHHKRQFSKIITPGKQLFSGN